MRDINISKKGIPIPHKLNRNQKFSKFIIHLVLSIGAIIMIFPFVWAVSVSLQGPGLAYELPPKFFKPPYFFKNYITAIKDANMLQYCLNSLWVSALCVLGAVISNTFIGFGFAQYNFKGSQFIFFTVLATMMLPSNMTTIAHYMIWKSTGALDTYIPLTLPSFLGGAMMIFLCRQHFLSIPKDMYEAALVDGANPLRIFFQIYLPISKAIIATIAINTFQSSWNNMFHSLIYLTTKSKYTISIGLLYLKGTFEANNLEILLAASVLAMIPIIIVYFCAQKQFVEGMVAGAVKG